MNVLERKISQADYDINDLPRFSPWPARLLGIDRWQCRKKTTQEVWREYEYEKWGSLVKRVVEADHRISVEKVDEWIFQDIPACLCSIQGRLKLLSAKEAHQQYLDLIEELLRSYLPGSAVVELGAGYGSVILALAKREAFHRMRIIAGEYSTSGLELIKRLALAQSLEIETGHCDFALPQVVDFGIPRNAVIFTSYATHYVPRLSTDFIRGLSTHHPRVVVHIEPCYEHHECNSLLGLMRRRYIQVNDYNTNLVTLLHDQE